MTQPLNAKGRPFSWSLSRWKDFDNCPAKYAAASFYCTLPYVESDAAKWGNRVHKAAEMYLKAEPHKDVEALLPVEKYVEKIMRSGNKVRAELEIVLDKDMGLVLDWFSKKAWLRCKIDVVIFTDKHRVNLLDWKTGGKVRHEDAQLELNALALMVARPDIQEVTGRYVWTQHDKVTPIRPVLRKDFTFLWEEWLSRAHRMEEAWRLERFPERPNPLCGWCAVEGCNSRMREYVGR